MPKRKPNRPQVQAWAERWQPQRRFERPAIAEHSADLQQSPEGPEGSLPPRQTVSVAESLSTSRCPPRRSTAPTGPATAETARVQLAVPCGRSPWSSKTFYHRSRGGAGRKPWLEAACRRGPGARRKLYNAVINAKTALP